jgi:hypothetical protein
MRDVAIAETLQRWRGDSGGSAVHVAKQPIPLAVRLKLLPSRNARSRLRNLDILREKKGNTFFWTDSLLLSGIFVNSFASILSKISLAFNLTRI